jgi:predicted DNA-binding transcriptional regulator YafY
MRADRLLSILLLLHVHRRLTARDLAGRLEVSARTVHRDMEALTAAGVPVYAQRGAGGGWILAAEYRTRPTGLSEAEVQSLFLATPARLLADLGLDGAARAALLKLMAALPTARPRDAEDVRQRIHIDVAGWRPTDEAVPWLPTLQEAIWQERTLHLSYARDGGPAVERLVEPLGLVAKGSVWYLVAAVAGEPRTYRVSRVQAARVTDEAFVRPAGFDLAAYWEESKARFTTPLPGYLVAARATAEVVRLLPYAGFFARVEQTDPPGPDGLIGLRLRFDVEENALACLASFGPRLEVIDPPRLRARLRDQAAAVVALYRTEDG